MSALAVSQIEKNFVTNQIYKRSKRYFDVIRLKQIEDHSSKFRRKPDCCQKLQLQRKIELSFMSSGDYFNKKRHDEIEKSRKRNSSSYLFDDLDETQTNFSAGIAKNLPSIGKKGFDMGKTLPRQFYQNLQNHSYISIEDPFDIFVTSDFSKGEKSKSIDFNKTLGRNDTLLKHINLTEHKIKKQINSNEQINSPNPSQPKQNKTLDINKIYEKNVFDQSSFKCLIDVQKLKKAQHRKSLRTSLPRHQPKYIEIERIQRGRSFSHKKPTSSSLMFYYGKGKQQPSQMHLRTLRKNQNYWLEQLGGGKKEDYETVRKRQRMIQLKLSQTKRNKCVADIRGEICDAKYFLRLKKE